MRLSLLPSAVAALIALPAIAEAQSRGGTARDTVPVSMYPPAGKCRIWMFGVPAAQQPATTDCGTALRQKPANSIVLYGPAQRDADSERFDPKVGEAPRSQRAGDLKTNGSPAEQELERRREDAALARQRQEMQEREERRRAATERAAILGARADTRGSSGSPPPPRNSGTTAVPRSSTANSTGSSGSASPPPSPPKPPAEKKKPE